MTPGDVVRLPFPQADGLVKDRPAVLLCRLPPYGDWLLCGVSTQLQREVRGFDEVIAPPDADFRDSALRAPSLIRLGFLYVVPSVKLIGAIGSISPERHRRLLQNLAAHLLK